MISRYIFFFFFSSRRRHTRLTCDWSSDVCSSDLGFALGAVAPPQVFTLKLGRQATLRTMTGVFKVKPLGPTVDLAELPLVKARKPIVTALVSLARDTAYQNWLLAREKAAQPGALCWRDQLPAIAVIPLTDYLPYLALDSGAAAATTKAGPAER